MNTLPEVSIIIPIYNVEKYIEKCVDSVFRQTYENFELLLVNDGSTDRSYEIIQKYLLDSRCIIIDKSNGGQSSARNVGFDIAKGKYVFFMDSDDTIDEHTIELLVKKMQETDADFCCYRISFVKEGCEFVKLHGYDFEVKILEGQENIVKDALLGKNIKITVWAKMFRHNFLLDNHIRFQEGIINEDCLYTLTCAIYAHKVAFLNVPLYYALERSGSTSRNIKRENITSYFLVFNVLAKLLEEKNIFDTYYTYYRCCYVKQILFTLVQAAFKITDKSKFLIFFCELKEESYLNMEISKHIKLLSKKYYFLYRLSLHPVIFYRAMKLLRILGVKMY